MGVARACGATIVNRTDEITEEDIGTGAGLFEVRKIGDEYFTFIEQCKDPKACTILLRGASKDILNEVERNLQDALNVARNLYQEPALVPGGGATEMEVAHLLTKGKDLERCCPMAVQSCCIRSRGDPKNSCTKLWRQHHPHPHCLESQARQGGGEERELGN